MIITICGGGNAAHTLAGLLGSQKDIAVRVYAPFDDEAGRWQEGVQASGGIIVSTPTGERVGTPRLISREASEALPGAQLVILALPAFAHETTLQAIAPYLEPGSWVGALPARGGFDLGAHFSLATGAAAPLTLFGLQTLPWACRIQQYGRQAVVLGVKDQVDLAAWPPDQAPAIAARLGELLGVSLNPVAGFLSLTLADTGQIIHPGIMYGLFHAWDGQPYPSQLPFYQSVDAAIAQTLQCMSDEIQNLRLRLGSAYPELDLSAVRPLSEWMLRSYQGAIADASTLQSQFATNRSYAGLLAPMRPVEGRFIPDFQARYLAEDVPYNLLVTRGIAELAGVSMPVIDSVLAWAQARMGKEYLVDGRVSGADLPATRAPQRFAISSLDQYMGRFPKIGRTKGAAPPSYAQFSDSFPPSLPGKGGRRSATAGSRQRGDG
jgi:hypothetical protein